VASLGLGTGHHHEELWRADVCELKPGPLLDPSDTFAHLTWRLIPEAAVYSLKVRAASAALTAEQRRLAVDSIAFIKLEESAAALMNLVVEASAVRVRARWWLKNRSEGEWASFLPRKTLEKRGLFGVTPASASSCESRRRVAGSPYACTGTTTRFFSRRPRISRAEVLSPCENHRKMEGVPSARRSTTNGFPPPLRARVVWYRK
jgi:hypothetical protein